MGVTTSIDDGHDTNSQDYVSQLPQDCQSNVIALTSARDACRSSAVSAAFQAAADANSVWEKFIPPDLPSILERAEMDEAMPLPSAKKELYLHLCSRGILIDGGTKSFRLDRPSGAKIYFLSARALFISWGDDPQYWRWVPHQDSRFSEVAELLTVCWFEVWAKFPCKELTPETNYAAYLVFKTTNNSHGLEDPIYEAILSIGVYESTQIVSLKPSTGISYQNVRLPRARLDGWMEIKLGDFYNDDGENGEVVMKLLEIKRLWGENGIIVEGIEIRPESPN